MRTHPSKTAQIVATIVFLGVSTFQSCTARADAPNCYMDGAFITRCPGDNGSSWPVYTAPTPQEVHAEMFKRYQLVPEYQTKRTIQVRHVYFGTYPDIVCFNFKNGHQTCFDTMEITER